MVKTVFDKPAAWLAGTGSEAETVLACRGTLARNLADLPFPWRCMEEEIQNAETRILAALEQAGFLATGSYCAMKDLQGRELRFVAERLLMPIKQFPQDAPGGVYFSEDQSFAVIVNGLDHLRIVSLVSGLQPQELWGPLDRVDNALAASLDYAFDEDLGYLTASLDEVGTGLQVMAFLHLPAMSSLNALLGEEQHLREGHFALEGVFGPVNQGPGDVYRLSNRGTLGISEEELAFNLRHAVEELLAQEGNARRTMLEDGGRGVEDRVGRALGMARGARLLDLSEAVSLLSSIRLGAITGILEGYSPELLNELLLAAQPGHLEQRKNQELDELTLNADRADLFRARFS